MGLGSFTEDGTGRVWESRGYGSPQGFAPPQLAPVTCSISNSPGDHRAGNKPDIHHYYHNDDGGSYRDDDSAMTMSDCRFKTTITESKMPGFFTSNRKLEWAWQWYAMMGNSATRKRRKDFQTLPAPEFLGHYF